MNLKTDNSIQTIEEKKNREKMSRIIKMFETISKDLVFLLYKTHRCRKIFEEIMAKNFQSVVKKVTIQI